SKMPFGEKVQSFVHLWSNLAYPLILICAILTVPVLLIKLAGHYDNVYKFMSVFVFAFIGSFLFYLYSQKDVYTDWQKRIIYFPLFLAGSMGLSVNNTRAVFEGLFGKKSEFVRTPKFNIKAAGDKWMDKSYQMKKIPFTSYIEGFLALYCGSGVVIAIANAQIAAVPFQLMFTAGFGMMAVLSIRQVVMTNKAISRKMKLAQSHG